MEKNKNAFGIIIAVLAVVFLLFFVFKKDKVPTDVSKDTNSTDTTTVIQSNQDTNGATGVGAVSISYTNALAKYADRRIQLDSNCQASRPNVVTYKDNTGIMIDNRSNQTRTVKVGTTFTIKPYGFKIVVLPDTYLKSKTLLVDCDKSQNVATILVQE